MAGRAKPVCSVVRGNIDDCGSESIVSPKENAVQAAVKPVRSKMQTVNPRKRAAMTDDRTTAKVSEGTKKKPSVATCRGGADQKVGGGKKTNVGDLAAPQPPQNLLFEVRFYNITPIL